MTNPFATPEAARQYMEMDKSHHFKWHSIFPTTLGLLGKQEIEGRSYLDIGCGYGAFSEMLVGNGASRVVGVDSSVEMIKLANERRINKHPWRISYYNCNAEHLPSIGEFDAATALLFFNYQDRLQTIEEICERVYSNLKPEGIFVAFQNHFQDSDVDFNGRSIGNVSYKRVGQTSDGAEEWQLVRQGDVDSRGWNFFSWKKEHYETALRNAGFRTIAWHKPIISQLGMDTLPKQWVLDYINSGLFRGFEAIK